MPSRSAELCQDPAGAAASPGAAIHWGPGMILSCGTHTSNGLSATSTSGVTDGGMKSDGPDLIGCSASVHSRSPAPCVAVGKEQIQKLLFSLAFGRLRLLFLVLAVRSLDSWCLKKIPVCLFAMPFQGLKQKRRQNQLYEQDDLLV